MKILVLGVNHAGTSAVRTILALDGNKQHEVVVYDRQKSISFLGCGIALSVSGVVKEATDLFYCNPQKLKLMGGNINTGYEILNVDIKNKKVLVENIATKEQKTETYDKLIYALGSHPIPSNAENSHLKNVIVCKTYADSIELKRDGLDDNIKTIAIVGAGYIGIELAEAFVKKGKKVHIIEMNDRILANNTDSEIAHVLQGELIKNGIELNLNQKVIKYSSKDGKLSQVTTDKETFDIDLVIESIGIKPNTSIIDGLEKISNGAIKVDNKSRSLSDPNIYVLGDAAAIYFASSKQYQNIALATTAVKTGIVSAADIMGIDPISLDSVTGTNALCVFNKKIATTGLTHVQAKHLGMNAGEIYFEDNDLPEWMGTVEKVAIKLVYDLDNMKLLGAQILSYDKNNHSEWILALSLSIQQGLTLFQIATSDVYFLPHLNKPFNFVLSAILKVLGLNYFEE